MSKSLSIQPQKYIICFFLANCLAIQMSTESASSIWYPMYCVNIGTKSSHHCLINVYDTCICLCISSVDCKIASGCMVICKSMYLSHIVIPAISQILYLLRLANICGIWIYLLTVYNTLCKFNLHHYLIVTDFADHRESKQLIFILFELHQNSCTLLQNVRWPALVIYMWQNIEIHLNGTAAPIIVWLSLLLAVVCC